jgi:hypothetical protein
VGLGSHVSVGIALGMDESFDDSSVQFLALYAQAQADIPLFLLRMVTFTSLGSLSSSLGLVVESMVQGSILHVIVGSRLFHIPIHECKKNSFYYVVVNAKY